MAHLHHDHKKKVCNSSSIVQPSFIDLREANAPFPAACFRGPSTVFPTLAGVAGGRESMAIEDQ
jgi:hypothetical protein